MLLIGGVLACVGAGIVLHTHKDARNRWQLSAYPVLAVYLFLVYYATVINRTGGMVQETGFYPFWSYRMIAEGDAGLVIDNIANVLVFTPVGFLLRVLFPNIKGRQVLAIGFCISLSIEVMQLVLKRGMFEFDDMFHNSLGCVLGWVICGLVRKKRADRNDS